MIRNKHINLNGGSLHLPDNTVHVV